MKTQKIKLFKPWHKALIAGIWVGMFVWLGFELKPTIDWISIAVLAGFSSFITAFPYAFLRSHLARKAGIPIVYDGWDDGDEYDGFHIWNGSPCVGNGHTPIFSKDR
jgi:hypothetical protein